MGASLHSQHQKEIYGLERTQRTVAKKIQNGFVSKVMCMVFWDAKEVIWQEYLLKGITINVKRFCEIFKNLRKIIKKKRTGLLLEGVILLYDSACPRSANVSHELLQQFQWDVFRYSPTSLHILHFSSPQGRA